MTTFRTLFSLFLSFVLSYGGYRKKSLSKAGALSAFVVGFITCYAGFRFAITLITFFVTSSALTKWYPNKCASPKVFTFYWKSRRKEKLDSEFKEGGQRNYIQVFANGGTATVLLLVYLATQGDDILVDYKNHYWSSFILCSFLGHYSACNGDTWSSEVGILSKSPPILITTGKKVPTGTNGAVSAIGLFAAVAGGALIGFVFWLGGAMFVTTDTRTPPQWPLILLGTAAGLLGSLIDSVLGATLQLSLMDKKTGKVTSLKGHNECEHIAGIDVLDNHQVNFLSALITSVLTAFIAQYWL